MRLEEHSLTITPDDLQGRDQIWVDFGPGEGKIHLTLHKKNFRIVAWVDKTWSKLVKKMYRI